MLVKDVMTTEVITVSASAPLKEAAELLIEHGVSGMPVVEDERVVGVISKQDFLVKEQGPAEAQRLPAWLTHHSRDEAKLAARTVRGAMSSPAVTVTPSATVSGAARRMLDAGVDRLPVLDGDELVGIVTRTDLVRAFARSDTEVEQEINERVLGHDLWLDGNAVHASVVDGNVTVDGASDEIDREVLERLVARVPGVVSVTVHG